MSVLPSQFSTGNFCQFSMHAGDMTLNSTALDLLNSNVFTSCIFSVPAEISPVTLSIGLYMHDNAKKRLYALPTVRKALNSVATRFKRGCIFNDNFATNSLLIPNVTEFR